MLNAALGAHLAKNAVSNGRAIRRQRVGTTNLVRPRAKMGAARSTPVPPIGTIQRPPILGTPAIDKSLEAHPESAARTRDCQDQDRRPGDGGAPLLAVSRASGSGANNSNPAAASLGLVSDGMP